MYEGVHVQYTFFLFGFNTTRIFLADCQKNIQISYFMKIRPVGAELFYADGQTYDDANNLFS